MKEYEVVQITTTQYLRERMNTLGQQGYTFVGATDTRVIMERDKVWYPQPSTHPVPPMQGSVQ